MNAIGNVINQIDSLVWGWWMIILLLGTHIFMTIRTGVIPVSYTHLDVYKRQFPYSSLVTLSIPTALFPSNSL